MVKKKDKPAGPPHPPRFVNRKARHNFHILEVVECGLSLEGSEVKSLRAGQAKIDEGYARVRNGQAFLVGVTIAHYAQAAPLMQHDPLRDRKLLLHRRQIDRLQAHTIQKGRTLVPLAIYFKDGWAKCELGLAVGKRAYDRRQDIKNRDMQRDIQREMNRRRRG